MIGRIRQAFREASETTQLLLLDAGLLAAIGATVVVVRILG
jgi:hypothetical protein